MVLIAVRRFHETVPYCFYSYDIRKEHPVIGAYMDRVRDRVGHSDYDDAHSEVNRIQAKYPDGQIPGLFFLGLEFLKARIGL